jgi:hypothetical protein
MAFMAACGGKPWAALIFCKKTLVKNRFSIDQMGFSR